MKHFVIADVVQSNLIYCDHPNGAMSHLLIDQTQSVLETSLNESASHWRAGKLLFVVGRFANVSAMVVSDGGESVRVLHNQLRLVYDLLLLAFGYAMLHESRSVNFAKFAPLIRSIVDTATSLADANAAFLVQATEQVEITDDMRLRFAALLRATCAAAPLVTAAFLFVETKLLTSYSRPKTTGVHPIDVLLLSIFLTSQLDPLLRDTSCSPATAFPVADYTDHATVTASTSATTTTTTTTSSSASTAAAAPAAAGASSPSALEPSPPAAASTQPPVDDGGGPLSGLSLPAVEDTIAATTAFISNAVNGLTGTASDSTAAGDAAAAAAAAATASSSSAMSSSSLSVSSTSRTASRSGSSSAPLFKVLFLRPGDKTVSTARELSARRVYIARLMSKITFVAVLRDDSGAGAASAEEQRVALDAVRDELSRSMLRDYAEFLQTRAQVHVSMLNYVYDLPGLVHFIFVDRTAHRVLVPTVTPLHGQDCTSHTPESSARMANILRREIWRMVNFAQSSLVRGSIATLVRRGAFLYSSRLWIEDGDGFELIVEHPLFSDAALVRDANAAFARGGQGGGGVHHRLLDIDDGLGDDDRSHGAASGSSTGGGSGAGGGALGANADEWASTNSNTWGAEFYPALVQRLYPTQRYVRIYELYTLYIGMLTAQHVAVCDRKLLSSLQIAS